MFKIGDILIVINKNSSHSFDIDDEVEIINMIASVDEYYYYCRRIDRDTGYFTDSWLDEGELSFHKSYAYSDVPY